MRSLWTFVVALALLAPAAAADTIVLKNGRRIRADYVVIEGDRVRFETPAGWMSLPLSLVARIETGPAGNDFGHPAAPFSAPALESGIAPEDVSAAVLRDGSVNREWLAQLELQARSADPQIVARVVAAHHAAAQFFLRRGELEPAMAHYRRALHFAPDEPLVLLHLAYLHLRRSEFTAALDYLDRARRRIPDSPDVAKLAGWAHYGSNRLEQAVTEWRRALALRPDAEVAAALEKAERDLEMESSFRGGQSRHFTLRYDGNTRPELAYAILGVLEEHFAAIAAELNYTPSEPIGVVLYADRSFADITRAPAWASAVNDGRLRVPVQGLTQVTPELARVLRHELAHSFLAQKTGGRCPVWLHEGVAQWIEGQRSRQVRTALLAAAQTHGPLPLAALEHSWTQLPAETASLAYAWSLAVVEFIVETYGQRDLERILARLAVSATAEQAFQEILRTGYAELEQQTLRYLSRH